MTYIVLEIGTVAQLVERPLFDREVAGWSTASHTKDFKNGTCRFFVWRSALIVRIEVLRPSEPNGVMSSAVSLPDHTFTGQA